ncbi:hypothetical protein PC128_g16697 [Phytophthora cactorum]|nr:hypothetical protein PC128_g16697 [Phytophthora cactorum]
MSQVLSKGQFSVCLREMFDDRASEGASATSKTSDSTAVQRMQKIIGGLRTAVTGFQKKLKADLHLDSLAEIA